MKPLRKIKPGDSVRVRRHNVSFTATLVPPHRCVGELPHEDECWVIGELNGGTLSAWVKLSDVRARVHLGYLVKHTDGRFTCVAPDWMRMMGTQYELAREKGARRLFSRKKAFAWSRKLKEAGESVFVAAVYGLRRVTL